MAGKVIVLVFKSRRELVKEGKENLMKRFTSAQHAYSFVKRAFKAVAGIFLKCCNATLGSRRNSMASREGSERSMDDHQATL